MENNGATAALLLGVWATFALDVYSTLNSSPQTTELFASDREDTLMHWVKIGAGVAVIGGVAGTVRSGSPWPMVGAVTVTVMMFYFYRHAVQRGIDKPPPANASR